MLARELGRDGLKAGTAREARHKASLSLLSPRIPRIPPLWGWAERLDAELNIALLAVCLPTLPSMAGEESGEGVEVCSQLKDVTRECESYGLALTHQVKDGN